MLQSGAHSDVELRSHALHRCILQARCPALLDDSARRSAAIDALSDEAFDLFVQLIYGVQRSPMSESMQPACEEESGALAQARAAATALGVHLDEPTNASLARLFDDDAERERFADLRFECQAQAWRVHSLFVHRVPLFATMLSSGMKEQESGTIVIDDVEPESVRLLLRFLYCGSVELPGELATEMLELAHRYELELLSKRAATAIMQSFDWQDPETVLHVFALATRLQNNTLKRVAANVVRTDFPRQTIHDALARMGEQLTPSVVTSIRAIVSR